MLEETGLISKGNEEVWQFWRPFADCEDNQMEPSTWCPYPVIDAERQDDEYWSKIDDCLRRRENSGELPQDCGFIRESEDLFEAAD